jgi:uncharacterized RDD family membrane protein YckC
MSGHAPLQSAGLGRRFASMLYEALLLLAVLFAAAFAFQGATHGVLEGVTRHVFQLYLLLVGALYFVWPWVRAGQTLPMKTWKLRLVRIDGAPVDPARALARYGLCCVSLLALGVGFAWALVDRDRQFLHDRIAGTRIVVA